MELDELIIQKKKDIEDATMNKINIIENNTIEADAAIDFRSWEEDRRNELPTILYKKNHEEVSILHELLHIEIFFIDEYSIVAFDYSTIHQFDFLYPTISVYKDIPEHLVVHRLISKYGYEPINCEKTEWFDKSRSIKRPPLVLAANLINYYSYSEYCPGYIDRYEKFYREVSEKRVDAFNIAEKGIRLLSETDIHKKESIDQCVERIIELFSPKKYIDGVIFAAHFEKIDNKWKYVPTFTRSTKE